jgi:hypothetical protein
MLSPSIPTILWDCPFKLPFNQSNSNLYLAIVVDHNKDARYSCGMISDLLPGACGLGPVACGLCPAWPAINLSGCVVWCLLFISRIQRLSGRVQTRADPVSKLYSPHLQYSIWLLLLYWAKPVELWVAYSPECCVYWNSWPILLLLRIIHEMTRVPWVLPDKYCSNCWL